VLAQQLAQAARASSSRIFATEGSVFPPITDPLHLKTGPAGRPAQESRPAWGPVPGGHPDHPGGVQRARR